MQNELHYTVSTKGSAESFLSELVRNFLQSLSNLQKKLQAMIGNEMTVQPVAESRWLVRTGAAQLFSITQELFAEASTMCTGV